MEIRTEPFPTISGPEKAIFPMTSQTVPGIIPTSASLLQREGNEQERKTTLLFGGIESSASNFLI
jgi:hypothetical protein